MLRTPIPEIHNLGTRRLSLLSVVSTACSQLHELIKEGHIHATVTEKTDGMAYEIGYDAASFYTRTSSSEKYRMSLQFDDMMDRYPNLSNHFNWLKLLHQHFFSNKKLVQFLEEKEMGITGELFIRAFGKNTKDGGIIFHNTKYDEDKLAEWGMFVLHTQLNQPNIQYELCWLMIDSKLNFDTDYTTLYGANQIVIDVQDELAAFTKNDLLNPRRTIKTRNDPRWYIVSEIAQSVKDKIEVLVHKCNPKWGLETEGWIIHTKSGRYKILHPEYISRKMIAASGKQNEW